MNRQPGFFVVGDRAERLERHVQAFLGAEFVLEDMRGFGEGLVDVAAAQFGVEREVGVFLALEVLEVGEAAGGLQLIVHIGRRRHRLDLVVDRRQFVVFGDDRMRRGFGNMGIGREHHGDRLADETHLVDGENRLVVEGRPVIGIGDHLADVVGGNDAENAGNFLGRAHVDRLDAAVRHGGAKNLAVQHAGQPHQVRVLGPAGDLLAPFEAWHRAADLAAAHGIGRHQQ
jgi:hypothetical protein